MPKAVKVLPDSIRLFQFHGVDLDFREGQKEIQGTCPFCNGPRRFAVKVESSQWRCFSCNEGGDKGVPIKGGNNLTFLRTLWRLSHESTRREDWKGLAQNRKLLRPGTPESWGVAKSILNGEWLIPGYTSKGELSQLYAYRKLPGKDKAFLMASPGLDESGPRHGVHGVPLLSKKKKETLFLAEGVWDGMALWETLKWGDPKRFASIDILAVPGCNTFFKQWLPLFAGRKVVILFDSDHPREERGRVIPPGGYEGVKAVARMLMESGSLCKGVSFLKWGPDGYDPQRPHGYDVRDLLTSPDFLHCLPKGHKLDVR